MKEDPSPVDPQPSTPNIWLVLAFLSFCMVIVHAALVYFRFPGILEGSLIDSDGYSRLIRVARLHETGKWFDTILPTMNAPYGLEFHWTRPLDILLLIGGWLLSPIVGFKSALFWSGAFLSPVLHILACLGLAWAVGPLFEAERRPMVIVVLLAQPIVTSYAVAGRADHHMLLFLIYVLSLGFLLRCIAAPAKRWPAVASGSMAGFGLWVSIEFLLPFLTLFTSLTLLWVAGFSKAASRCFQFSVGFAVVVMVAWMAEHPLSALLQPEYDRISAPHMLAALLAVFFWLGVTVLRGKGRKAVLSRTLLLFIGAAAAFGILALFFPGVFANPLTDVEPEFWELYGQYFQESQPLFPRNLSEVGEALFLLGSALITVPFGLWILFPHHRLETRAMWLPISLGLFTFVPLTLSQVRFGVWAGVVVAVALTGIISGVNKNLASIQSKFGQASARVILNASLILGIPVLGLGVSLLWGETPPPSELAVVESCAVDALVPVLADGRYGEESKTLLAGANIGPELAYKTPHSVIAAPYHRNGEGNMDTHRIMTSTDEALSRGMMATRSVDLVVLCPDLDRGFFQRPSSSGETLFRRLAEGRPPPWLRAVDLSLGPDSGFRVFEVVDF